jgi:hypothetical protein
MDRYLVQWLRNKHCQTMVVIAACEDDALAYACTFWNDVHKAHLTPACLFITYKGPAHVATGPVA